MNKNYSISIERRLLLVNMNKQMHGFGLLLLIMWSQHDSLREKALLLSESTFGMCNDI